MPIYAYRCTNCGHAQDVLRKISDPPLSVCPACGAATFVKQVTAAGFQLKGSGWYVTDFRGGNSGAAKKDDKAADSPAADAAASDKPADKSTEKAADKSAEKTVEKAADKPAASPPPPAPAPASGS